MCKIFSPSLHPPFTLAMAAKNITSPIAIFDPCTHEKNFFPPSTKKAVPMCAVSATREKEAGFDLSSS